MRQLCLVSSFLFLVLTIGCTSSVQEQVDSAIGTPIAPTIPPVETEQSTTFSLDFLSSSSTTDDSPYTAARAQLPPAIEARPLPVTFERISRMGTGDYSAAAISPDETKLAVATSLGTITIYGFPSLEVQSSFDTISRIFTLAWSPDNQQLAYGDIRGNVGVWNVPNAAYLFGAKEHTNSVRDLAWASDSRTLVSASDDRSVIVWDIPSGTLVRRLEGHTDWIRAVDWASDDRRVVTISDDGSAKVWDTQTGQSLQTYFGHGDEWLYHTLWIPETDLVLSARDSAYDAVLPVALLHLWDVTTGEKVAQWGKEISKIHALDWDASTRSVVVIADDVYLLDPETLTVREQISYGWNWIDTAQYLPDPQRLLFQAAGHVEVENLQTSEKVATLATELTAARALAWHPNGEWIFVGGDSRALHLWDPQLGAEVRALEGHSGWIRAVDINENNIIATASDDYSILLRELETETVLLTLEGHEDWVRDVAWAPAGTQLASVSDDGMLYIWDAETGAVLHDIAVSEHYLLSVDWSADGEHVAGTGEDDSVSIWNATTGQSVSLIPDFSDGAVDVEWSPIDPNVLAFGSANNEVFIYDISTNAVTIHLDDTTLLPPDRSWAYFSALNWSPDGRWLAVGNSYNTVTVFDTTTWQSTMLPDNGADISALVWDKDSKRLLVGAEDGQVVVWEMQE